MLMLSSQDYSNGARMELEGTTEMKNANINESATPLSTTPVSGHHPSSSSEELDAQVSI